MHHDLAVSPGCLLYFLYIQWHTLVVDKEGFRVRNSRGIFAEGVNRCAELERLEGHGGGALLHRPAA